LALQVAVQLFSGNSHLSLKSKDANFSVCHLIPTLREV
jgi:hypothetical protein